MIVRDVSTQNDSVQVNEQSSIPNSHRRNNSCERSMQTMPETSDQQTQTLIENCTQTSRPASEIPKEGLVSREASGNSSNVSVYDGVVFPDDHVVGFIIRESTNSFQSVASSDSSEFSDDVSRTFAFNIF